MKKKFIIFLIIIMSLAVVFCLTACGNEELKAPQNLRQERRAVIWNKVENATEYIIFVDDKEYTTTENRFDLLFLPAGRYEIEVMAVGNHDSSKWSAVNVNLTEIVSSGKDEFGFSYTLLEDGSGYEVSCGVANLNGTVTLPDFFCDLPVKRIADYAFCSKSTAVNYKKEEVCNMVTTNIILPKYLESIGLKALSCMVRLQEVVIPNGVTEIYARAFEGDTHLKKVTLSKSLKKIYWKAFYDTGLEELTLPDGLEEIGDSAFACDEDVHSYISHVQSNMSGIVIPKSVKRIDNGAFFCRQKLKDITFYPERLEYFGYDVFKYTCWYFAQPDGFVMYKNLLCGYKGEMPENCSLTIPSYIEFIGSRVLFNQDNLKKVVIHDGVKLIGDAILSSCDSLSEVVLPQDLEVIPDGTFLFCKELKSIIIPASLKILGENPFYNGQNIFYEGSLEQWTALKAQNNNDKMYGTIYTYSETAPVEAGNYWHYVDGEPVIW